MPKNKTSLFSFVTGVLSIVVVVFIAMLFPDLQLSTTLKNIVLVILFLPWVIFMLSLLFSDKDNK
ncbi:MULTISPECIES: hypothetical protein [Francisella]|uniref:hypothetical protein n=1 Tax=Francisella TaxID=262 RepID=UPI0008FC98D5|nr:MULTISPECIES: hypothetical protein [Francisella]